MLYKQPTFTLPACNQGVNDLNWDLAFLSKEEFIAKYGQEQYDSLTKGA